MTTKLTFDLTANNIGFDSDEKFQEELAKTGGKFFDSPGNVDLVIVAAAFHENKDTGSIYCKGDETWANVKVTFRGGDEKEIDHWVQIPTKGVTFGPKKTLMVFRKFQRFLAGIGVAVTLSTLQNIMQTWFTDPTKLVGQKVNADLGYEGDHVAKLPDGDEFVILVKGKPLCEDGAEVRLPDRASAVQYAKSAGIEPGFIRILKFTARKATKAKKTAATAEW